jgi:hypothetical protein
MAETRDARVDPMPGDVLRKFGDECDALRTRAEAAEKALAEAVAVLRTVSALGGWSPDGIALIEAKSAAIVAKHGGKPCDTWEIREALNATDSPAKRQPLARGEAS